MGADPVSGVAKSALTLRTPPHFGRRAVWFMLVALVLVGISVCIDRAAANQVGSSDMPSVWALYLAGVSLYYALICAVRWLRQIGKGTSPRRPTNS